MTSPTPVKPFPPIATVFGIGEQTPSRFSRTVSSPVRPTSQSTPGRSSFKNQQLFDSFHQFFSIKAKEKQEKLLRKKEGLSITAVEHPLSILIAEDNPINQKLLTHILQKNGYQPDIASNGLEVLQSLRRQKYDLIFMDVQMPEMDGFEATRQIAKRYPKEERPIIVAVTANAMKGDKELCEKAGMDDYISKPIRIEELKRVITKYSKK